MAKSKKNKTKKSILESLAANFDYALFDDLVRQKENDLRAECDEKSIPKRLYNLERVYGSRETAFRVLAEEKVMFKIHQKQNPDEDEISAKNAAQRSVAYSNGYRLRRKETSTVEDMPTSVKKVTGSNWRNWGQT